MTVKPIEEVLARMAELIREDKELHDAVVRWIHAAAEDREMSAALKLKRLNRDV